MYRGAVDRMVGRVRWPPAMDCGVERQSPDECPLQEDIKMQNVDPLGEM